jgi:hypothetical protein
MRRGGEWIRFLLKCRDTHRRTQQILKTAELRIVVELLYNIRWKRQYCTRNIGTQNEKHNKVITIMREGTTIPWLRSSHKPGISRRSTLCCAFCILHFWRTVMLMWLFYSNKKLSLWRLKLIWIIHKDSVRTSQRAFVRNSNMWLLYRELTIVYCKHQTDRVSTLFGKMWNLNLTIHITN